MAELAYIEAVVFLQSVPLFANCRAEEVLRIATIGEEARFAAGEEIYPAGAPPDRLHCLVHGAVRLEGPDGDSRRVGPPATFGVLDVLSGRLRAARAVAEADALILAIPAEDLFDLLAHNIEIVKALFRHVILSLQESAHDGGPA
ncbi:MAG: cyclic nucleotide-binding domain-containing protein [Thermoanaerobaculia bacterium]